MLVLVSQMEVTTSLASGFISEFNISLLICGILSSHGRSLFFSRDKYKRIFFVSSFRAELWDMTYNETIQPPHHDEPNV